MADSEQTSKPGEDAGASPEAALAASITTAFNFGVSANQQAKGTKSIAQAMDDMAAHIFSSLSKSYGGKFQQEYITANAEYLLQIALLGYIIPSICDYEENFKERLLSLIESRAKKQSAGDGKGGGGSIITP